MTQSPVSWSIANGIDEMAALFDEWDNAVADANTNAPYCGRQYQMAILETYHKNHHPVLIAARLEGVVSGLLVLVSRPMTRMGQTIREIGFPFNPNTILNHPLIDVTNGAQADMVANALLEGAFSTGADSVLLDHMSADSGFATLFQMAARRAALPYDPATNARALYYGTLGGDWEAYLATRSRNHRWQVKKAIRKADNNATISTVRCDTRDRLRAHLDDWFAVEARSWQGAETETAMSDADREFHTQLIEDLPEENLGDLWLVYSAKQPIAALRMLAGDGQVSVHTMHFDANFKANAPGAIAFYEMMQAACNAGLTEVDMHGTTGFFSRFATGQREHRTVRIYRKGLRGLMLQKMRGAALSLQAIRAKTAP